MRKEVGSSDTDERNGQGKGLVKMSLALTKLSPWPVHHLEAEDAHWGKWALRRSCWQASVSSIIEWKKPRVTDWDCDIVAV